MGNSHPNIAPYSVYKTKDGQYIVIGVATDAQFKKFCEIIGGGIYRAIYHENKMRCVARDRLNAEI